MARKTLAPTFTDEQMARKLDSANKDEQEGRLVHCENEGELRKYFRGLRAQA